MIEAVWLTGLNGRLSLRQGRRGLWADPQLVPPRIATKKRVKGFAGIAQVMATIKAEHAEPQPAQTKKAA